MTKLTRLKEILMRAFATGSLPRDVMTDDELRALQMNPQIVRMIAEATSAWIANLPEDDFVVSSSVGGVVHDAPDHPTSFLPKCIETLPDAGRLSGIKWATIGQLPGYQQSGIRKMGRDIFLSFPCFQLFADALREQGRDALAEIRVASDLTHHQSAINMLADMIAAQGKFFAEGEMAHDHAIPGYRPRIAIFMTDDWTFKLVQDRPEYGAPVSMNSIYAWPGGLRVYKPRALTEDTLPPALSAPINAP